MKQGKKILTFVTVTACMWMLAGCQSVGDKNSVPTPTAVQKVTETPAVTATVTPESEPEQAVTDTSEQAATSTPAPTATSTPKPTATNTPAPTATSSPVPTKAPVTTEGTLTGLNAFEITSQMIVGWNLGNTLESTGANITFHTAPAKAATAWGNIEPTPELFEAVKAAGFNTVRIPITWYQHVRYDSNQDKYIINEEWLVYVKKTVDYAYELDMFVILNVHHEDWVNVAEFTDTAYNKAEKMLKDIWTQVAEAFADYDQHLIFEGMNEPRQTGLGGSVEWGGGDKESWQYVNNLNQVFVNTVRGQGSAENTERLLMLPGYGASSNIATVKSIEVPENGGNIALSVHAYYPYFFAMDTSSYANHSFPGKSGYGENYETSISSLFRDLKQISADKNVPIIIGEFGASDFKNDEDRARWATHFLSCAKNAGIPCVFWDNGATYNGTGEAHGMIYRKTCTWFESAVPMLNAAMAVYNQESNLPAYEVYVQPAFDWNSIGMTEDWVQIFRSDAGQSIDAWGNIWLENWKPYLSVQYDIVVIYCSEAEPYMVLQGGWYKIFSSEVNDNPYMIRFTFADVQNTMTAENVTLENMSGYFVSAGDKPMTVYGVFAVPVK